MLNPYETQILITLIKNPKYQNTTEISKATKISWNTTEKYLEEMHEKGWLEKKGRTKIYWKAIIKNEK
ncbi:helix-turn-helix domain-containing protein [archaeon]|jgi:Mn-dependent DtxR family transcriptional regulator|nr:helix-turn-helix domain-containing protein [archaeon]